MKLLDQRDEETLNIKKKYCLFHFLFVKYNGTLVRKIRTRSGEKMTRIPEEDRNIMEKAIYLPMVLIVLNRDLSVVEKSSFKLKKPYLELIEETMKDIQGELAEVKKYMKRNKLQVTEINRDDAFTMYLFIYKGYEENHNYFNPRIRNKVQELMTVYFLAKRKV
jgi:hypothetical protein